MNEGVKQGFIEACTNCLDAYALMSLRSYARHVGVDKPTMKQKGDLIAEIIGVLLGEIPPVERATRGAPVKDDFVDPAIIAAIHKLQLIYDSAESLEECKEREKYYNATWQDRRREIEENPFKIVIHDSMPSRDKLYTGQVKMYDGVACLLPLNFDISKGKIILPVEMIRRYDLREGDVVDCHVYVKNSVIYADEIYAINDVEIAEVSRQKFDESSVTAPTTKIAFFNGVVSSVEAKCLDWLLPVGQGQRCLIAGAPKTGKTQFTLRALKSLKEQATNLEVLALLIEQAPEILSEYQKLLDSRHLISTTFADDASKHVLAAEFLLERAKRFAEMGKDVLLIVDSLGALAKAYDETADTDIGKLLPCGLGTGALHYIKKYFASARKFDKKGSLTIVATTSKQTGVPADEVLYAELSSVANHQVCLDVTLAVRRIFPALDFAACHTDYVDALLTAEEKETEFLFRNQLQPCVNSDFLVGALTAAKDFVQFRQFLVAAATKTKA